MIYREFGKTGKRVSAVGFGGMRFKPEQYANNDYSKCVDTILYAREQGINYFDTGALYTDNLNENIFGQAFSQIKKDFYVTAKASTTTTGEKTSDEVLRSIERSLKTMHVDKIDFMFLWCVLSYEMGMSYFNKGGVMEGFNKAKELGLIDHICISTHANGEDVRKLLETEAFDGVLLGYNVINFPYRQDALDYAKEAKIGVVTMNPLGGGIIPENPDYFSFLKANEEDSAVKGAIRFNVAHEEITVTLVGMNERRHIDEAIEAIEDLSLVTKENMEAIKAKSSKKMDTLCTGCNYCKNCPAEIPIPKFMDIYNMHMLGTSKEELMGRLSMHWKIDDWQDILEGCTQCGQCEEVCTQKLPILKRFEEVKEICK